jgi:hypothetical protein
VEKGVIRMNSSSNDFKSRMARYEQELLHLRQRSVTQEPPPPPPPPVVKPPVTESPLHVRVNSAQTGDPIAGAVVAVDRRTPLGREPLYVRITNTQGEIEKLTLPAGDGDTQYDITVAAPGFFRQTDTGLIADGTPIERVIRLAPLPEY